MVFSDSENVSILGSLRFGISNTIFVSFSGPASNGGSAPYMRQFRPRSNRNNGTTSLPASAVSAAPYIPPIYQQQGGNPDYMHHHQHVTYAYEAPPPPMGQPPPGWVPAGPYIYAGAGENPAPFVQHMCTMPPPQVVVSSSASSSRPTSSSRSTTAVSSSVSSTVSSNSTVVSSSEVHQPQEYEVEYHLHQGEVIQLQLGDGRVQIIQGKTLFFWFHSRFYKCIFNQIQFSHYLCCSNKSSNNKIAGA